MTVLTQLIALWRLPQTLASLRSDLMASEQENYTKLTSTVEAVKTGWTSLVAERDQYKAALESADADKAAAVQSALDEDSAHDADAIAAVDASLSELLPGQPVEVPAEGGTDGATEGPVETTPEA